MKSPTENPGPDHGARFVAVYGGAFDPPHLGHVVIPALVYGLSNAEHVLVVPSYHHPFAKKMADFEHRLEMCEAAFRAYEDLVTVSPIERTLSQGGESVYSIDLLDNLAAQHPNWRLRLVIGADAYAQRASWKNFSAIEERFAPLVIPRIGYLDTPHDFPPPPAIASSEFRESPSDPGIRQMIPQPVLDIISDRKLYRHGDNP